MQCDVFHAMYCTDQYYDVLSAGCFFNNNQLHSAISYNSEGHLIVSVCTKYNSSVKYFANKCSLITLGLSSAPSYPHDGAATFICVLIQCVGTNKNDFYHLMAVLSQESADLIPYKWNVWLWMTEWLITVIT